MKFSTTAATSIVPTLARLILAAAFISVGFNKCFTDSTFDATQAARLQALGITATPVEVTAAGPSGAHLVSFRQDDAPPAGEAGEAESEQDPPAETGDETPPADPAGDDAVADPIDPPQPEPMAEGEYTARSLYKIALLVDGAGWNSPDWMPRVLSWVAGLTEFVGGLMMLLGLFSRLWGLGLTITMGVAFYLVSMNGAGIPGRESVLSVSPFTWAENVGDFNMLYSQLGLGLMALMIMLVGPGPLSLDRRLFAKPKTDMIIESEEII